MFLNKIKSNINRLEGYKKEIENNAHNKERALAILNGDVLPTAKAIDKLAKPMLAKSREFMANKQAALKDLIHTLYLNLAIFFTIAIVIGIGCAWHLASAVHRRIALSNKISIALTTTSANVMIADENYNIIFIDLMLL